MMLSKRFVADAHLFCISFIGNIYGSGTKIPANKVYVFVLCFFLTSFLLVNLAPYEDDSKCMKIHQ